MTEDGLKHINDRGQIDQIIHKLFINAVVVVSSSSSSAQGSVLSYAGEELEVAHGMQDATGEKRILRLENPNNTIYLECRLLGVNVQGHERLSPLRLFLKPAIQRQERADASRNSILVVTNLVPLNSFIDRLASINHRRDALVQLCQEKLGQSYSAAVIELRRSFRMNPRMRLIESQGKPIFAPHRLDQEKWELSARVSFAEAFVGYSEYKTLESYEQRPPFTSEICEPLHYRNIFLYGYVQVTSLESLTLDDYRNVQRYARSLEKEFEQHGILPSNPEKSPVIDINSSGIGIMHPHNSVVMRDFHAGDAVIFDLNFIRLPPMAFSGSIANLRPYEKAHRIGIQFENLKDEQKIRLEAAIRELKKNQPSETIVK